MRLFLRLGLTAFGGPAVHVAMMHDEVVRRRGWVSDERFVDLVGATNLIPGPNSTELAIHLGWDRARGRGLVLAGVCFIAPAAVLVGALASVYVSYGQLPAFEGVLYGMKPVLMAIVLHAVVRLLPVVARTRWLAAVSAGAVIVYLLGLHELLVLAGAGALCVLLRAAGRARSQLHSSWLAAVAVASAEVDLSRLFLTFLRIGAVLYGSGYVLLAFLRSELVDRHGWISSQELLDAVAVGQATPGPVFTTATFVGYLVAGFWGAVVATVGIFLPSFLLVALLTRLVDRMRRSAMLGAALDGINAASVALIAGVSMQLAGDALVDPLAVVLLAGAVLVLWLTRLSSAWLLAAGAAVGLVRALAG